MNARRADDRYPVLVGDIGGTNARFASIRAPGAPPESIEVLRCADYPGPFEAIQHYLAVTGSPTPRRAGLAVATPVSGDQVGMTNSHWSFSRAALSAQLPRSRLVTVKRESGRPASSLRAPKRMTVCVLRWWSIMTACAAPRRA